MDPIFQTLTSLYTRSNSLVVIRSDFSHTSFLPGFQKPRDMGRGWGDLLSLSFSGCFKLWLTTVLPSSSLTQVEYGTKNKEPQDLESPFLIFFICFTCFTVTLSLIVKKRIPHVEIGPVSLHNLLCSQLLKKTGQVFTKILLFWEKKSRSEVTL